MQKVIPVRKMPGFSTYDLIRIFKKKTGFSGKIGHGGTLDPFASGVVLLLLGEATKQFETIKKWEKTYLAGIRLGASSSTQDVEGEIVGAGPCVCSRGGRPPAYAQASAGRLGVAPTEITIGRIKKTLKQFQGEITQRVPPYSAAKYHGQSFYKLARKGKMISKTKKVTIKEIKFVAYKWPLLTIRVTTLGGTYIRQLASDLAEKLDTVGFLYFLQRERVGKYKLTDCSLK